MKPMKTHAVNKLGHLKDKNLDLDKNLSKVTCKCLMDQTTGSRIAPQQTRSIRTNTFNDWERQ